MNEQHFLIDLLFKPNDSDSPLHPDELGLLLAHVGEILKELDMVDGCNSTQGISEGL